MFSKKTLLFFVLSVSFIIFIFACNKHAGQMGGGTATLPSEETVTASVEGRVVDDSGMPVKDAVVTAGGEIRSTDANGEFSFSNIRLSSRFGFVKVVKSGFFAGSRSIITVSGSSNYVSITLLSRVLKGSFEAANGGKISVSGASSVDFSASSVIVASTGAVYSGVVSVYAALLDPSDSSVIDRMPGDLRGIGSDGKETLLKSFGMMAVELEGASGEKLQLASGKKATLSMVVPAAKRASAGATIPLWYFNDSTGRWIEEGTASLQGGVYVGEVGHFTYWNCDGPEYAVNFSLHLQDLQGNPLGYSAIRFVLKDGGDWRGWYTDANGNASGLLPKEEGVIFQVVNFCGTVMFEKDLGVLKEDIQLGNVAVDLGMSSLVISGSVTDCYNSAIDSGLVVIEVDGRKFRAVVTAGNFSMAISRCTSEPVSATLTALDQRTLQTSEVLPLAVTKGSFDAGVMQACGNQLTQFVRMTIDGKTYYFTDPGDNFSYYVDRDFGEYGARSASGTSSFFMYFPFITQIGQTTSGVYFSTDHEYIYEKPGLLTNVTKFDGINESFEGEFSGRMKDTLYANPSWHNVSGNFRLIRRY